MPVSVSFIPNEDRLDLSFEGNLDVTVSHELCGLGAHIPASVRTCVMDLTRVQRVFDSGIALLQMLSTRMHRVGARVVVVSDHPDVRRQIRLILGPHPSASTLEPALVAVGAV